MLLDDALLKEFSTQLVHKNIFYRGSIPKKKLDGAIAGYASGVDPAHILVLFDGTLFGSAAEGFVITSEGVYCRNGGNDPWWIKFENISLVELQQGVLLHKIRINNSEDMLLPGLGVEQAKILAGLIDKMAQVRKALANPGQKPQPTAAAKSPVPAVPVASASTPAQTTSVIASLGSEVDCAKVERSSIMMDCASLELKVKVTNNTGCDLARIRWKVTVFDQHECVIGTGTNCSEEPVSASVTVELNTQIALRPLGGDPDESLRGAVVCVSGIAESEKRYSFAATRLASTPVDVAFNNTKAHANQFNIIGATAFFAPDEDSDRGGSVYFRTVMQNPRAVPLEDIGVRFNAWGFSDDENECFNRLTLFPHEVGSMEDYLSNDKFRRDRLQSVEIHAEVSLYEAVGKLWLRHKGIVVQDSDDAAEDVSALEVEPGTGARAEPEQPQEEKTDMHSKTADFNRQNELLDLAGQSWNKDMLVPIDTGLLKSRPLMVFRQNVIMGGDLDEYAESATGADKLIAHVKERAAELIGELAPFSFSFDFTSQAAVTFLLAIEDFEIAGSLRWMERAWPAAAGISIEKTLSDAQLLESAAEKGLGVALYTILLLPDEEQTSVDLGDIESAVPGIDGAVTYFDRSREQVQVQAWDNGERDTGYLEALDGNGDTDDYCFDDKPGRQFLVDLLKRLAVEDVIR